MLSKYSGERWSRLLVFAVKHFLRESPHAIPLWPFTLLLLVFHNAIWQIPLLVKCPFFLIHELPILVKINILTFNDQALIRIFALLNLATGRKPSFAEATEDKALLRWSYGGQSPDSQRWIGEAHHFYNILKHDFKTDLKLSKWEH